MTESSGLINPIDVEELRRRVRSATPFPNVRIDNFLEPSFAEDVHAAFPTFEQAAARGRTFKTVNESKKVQVTDAAAFPEAVTRLDRELSSPWFLERLSFLFEIPGLRVDPDHKGGGMHQTGPHGHLDVHVDFNFDESLRMHRRLNLLLYLNKDWAPSWGGNIELWDKDVKTCVQSLSPVFNRCVLFATSEISYHGVMAVRCPPDRTRKSFAAYYYTVEPAPGWDGRIHSTLFKARPGETLKGRVLMPLETASRRIRHVLAGLGRTARSVVKR